MKRDILRLFVYTALISSLSFVVSGCSKKEVQVDKAEDTVKVEAASGNTSGGGDGGQVQTSEINEGMGAAESLETQPSADVPEGNLGSLEGRTSAGLFPVYFDFDRSFIREDQAAQLEKNGVALRDNPGVNVAIEGNCDERGTNEYNMALGERRAMSTKKYLINLGVDPSRMNTISFGEERPINRGHDELSWSQNRRADFVIVQ